MCTGSNKRCDLNLLCGLGLYYHLTARTEMEVSSNIVFVCGTNKVPFRSRFMPADIGKQAEQVQLLNATGLRCTGLPVIDSVCR